MGCKFDYSCENADQANEHAIEALKQLLAIAGGVLALTITFLKDALSESRETASCKVFIPLGWTFLLISIWYGWVAIADAARKIGTRNEKTYAFAGGRTRLLARMAQYSLLLGLTLLGVFAIVNFGGVFRSISKSDSGRTPCSQEVEKSRPPFHCPAQR